MALKNEQDDSTISTDVTANALPSIGKKAAVKAISGYKAHEGMTKAHRVAHFLDWFAKRVPGMAVPPNVIFQAITGFPRTPRLDSPEARSVASTLTRARDILRTEYRRGLVSERGIGYRATIDDEDTADTQLRKEARRIAGAHRSLAATARIVDPAKIKSPEIKAWVSRAVLPALKALKDDDRITRLLAPAPPKDSK